VSLPVVEKVPYLGAFVFAHQVTNPDQYFPAKICVSPVSLLQKKDDILLLLL
jgi:hypothetical protein